MIKTVYAIILITSISFASFSQNVYSNYQDGVVYFKIKNSSDVELKDINGDSEGHVFETILENAGEVILTKAFKTQTPKVQRIYRLQFTNFYQVDLIIKGIEEFSYIEYAEKSPIYQYSYTPNDVATEQNWYLETIKAFEAWNMTAGEHDVKLAIVDDAIRITHEDLAGNLWTNPGEIPGDGIDNDNNGFIDDVNGWDAADNDNDPNPPAQEDMNPLLVSIGGEMLDMLFTHGTHTSGIAAGVTNNGTGIASISDNVSLIPVKVTADQNILPISLDNPAEGVDYAIAAGADIISMSFGGAQDAFASLGVLLDEADSLGVLLIAAAGNEGNSNPNYPAVHSSVISVGSTSECDSVSSFSQRGDGIVDIMAPGARIYSSLAHSTPYDYQDGTSMACPLVAGLAALMMSHDTTLTAVDVHNCLMEGVDNIDHMNESLIGQMGVGRINAEKAMACLMEQQAPIAVIPTFCDNYFACTDGNLTIINDSYLYNSVEWTLSGGSVVNEDSTSIEMMFDVEGSYSLELVVSNDYGADTAYATIEVSTCASIEENINTGFEMYPNPANDYVQLAFTIKGSRIQVLDIFGRIVEDVDVAGLTEYQLDLSSYAKGTYLVKLVSNSNQSIKPLVVH